MAENESLLRCTKLSPAAVKVLCEYSWPGNIRELRSVLTRAGIDCENDVIGSEISEFFEKSTPVADTAQENGKLVEIWRKIRAGETFWEAVKKPYLRRELNREEVRTILLQGLNECDRKYKDVARLFNLEDKEYHRFMAFLSANRLNKIN